MLKHSSVISQLNKVDWDFADYSSSQFPTDINSLHWYPGTFVPQIPAILIQTLSDIGDVVLDPFAGAGNTLIEASRLRRHYIGIDCNPHAVNIAKAKLQSIANTNNRWYENEVKAIDASEEITNCMAYCKASGIGSEVSKWFHKKTLQELLQIHNYIIRRKRVFGNSIRKVLFSAILKSCCSQRDHYTYITDGCFPKEMVYLEAKQKYIDMLSLTKKAIYDSSRQFKSMYDMKWNPIDDGILKCDDSRNLAGIEDAEIDLVVTSPPYLGVNDYVRSMRLSELFFPEETIDAAHKNEIGARRNRRRKDAFDEYINDMKAILNEISRVLKPKGYVSLVIGQGCGKVNRGNPVSVLEEYLLKEHGFEIVFDCSRKLKFRRIQVSGVGRERIMVLRRSRRKKT